MKQIVIVLILSACCQAQILSVPNGGTGKSTLAVHGPLVGNGTGPVISIGLGSVGWCFLSNGPSADPSFQACPGGGGGSGTVTSFSAGNLPSLFTTSVATPTTTPVLSFTLNNQAGNTIFGNFTGSSAAPAFSAISACGDSTHALSYTSGTGFGCQAISAGTGTVTSFSAGDLSPLFTTTEATPTTTPNLSFSLSAATASSLFGNISSTSAAPAFTPVPACGDATHALGWASGTGFNCQTLSGSGGGITSVVGTPPITVSTVSGTATISSAPYPVANITGTYNVTAADFQNCALKYVISGTVTVVLPPNTSQPPNGQCLIVMNYGTIAVNINHSGQNLNGQAGNTTIPPIVGATQFQPNSMTIWSDGTNYVITRGTSFVPFAQITTGAVGSATLTLANGSTLAFSGTGAIVSPVVNTGVAQGSGLKHQRVASCATTAVSSGSCAGTLTWTTAFADTSYTVSCSIFSATLGVAIQVTAVTASAVGYGLVNLGGNTTATSGTVECIAMHD